MSGTRSEYVDGLRQLADFIEAHPELPGLLHCRAGIYLWGDSAKAELAVAAMAMGTAAKRADDFYFGVEKSFGPVVLSVKAGRDNVCERVVTGTKTTEYLVPPEGVEMVKKTHTEDIVEWVCPPSLLALADEAVAS